MSSMTCPGAALAVAVSFALSACAPAIIGGGAVGGYGVSQERSTRDGLRDFDTEATINARLFEERGELFRRVSVEAVEGRVLLTGSVSNPEDSIRATEIAWSVPRVSEVTNELVVDNAQGAGGYAEDVWITTQLRTRLIGDARIASRNYNIETHRGVVHLIGLATTPEELRQVTAHAARVPGVREVVSHVILIDDPRRLSA